MLSRIFAKIRSLFRRHIYLSGFDSKVFFLSLRGLPVYFRDVRKYQKLNDVPSFRFSIRDAFPILTDMGSGAGVAKGHYFHQDLWAAKKIFALRPEQHLDVGSRIDGFVAHLLTFMSVTEVDIRSIQSQIPGLTFLQDDATKLEHLDDDSVSSLSTLHVAEHMGLGRYTDPVDPKACFEFMNALQRVLAPEGRLYFSVPIGRERVEFNAHRVFAPKTILASMPKLQLVSFSFVGDDGALYQDRDPLDIPESHYACGLFEFTKSTVGGGGIRPD